MQKFKTLADHIALAEFAHRNQTDKAQLPYIDHPKRVLAKVQAMGGLPYVQSAAILHDVTEDTAFTCDMLLSLGVSEAVVEIVRLVDRDYSAKTYTDVMNFFARTKHPKSYEDRWPVHAKDKDEWYYLTISLNPGAKMVKLADIEDNLAPWRQSYLPKETQDRLQSKYAKALDILGA